MFLTIKNDKLVVQFFDDQCERDEREIKSLEDFQKFMKSKGWPDTYCSSTLDFPEEATSNEETIRLANLIR